MKWLLVYGQADIALGLQRTLSGADVEGSVCADTPLEDIASVLYDVFDFIEVTWIWSPKFCCPAVHHRMCKTVLNPIGL